MKQLKKTMLTFVMAILLVLTAVPSTSMEVQAASVGKVTGVKAIYTKDKVTLTWKRASRAKKYEIYRSTNGKKYQKVKTVKGLSWQDTKKGELWYKVRAVNGKRKGKFSSATSIYTIGGRVSVRQTGNTFITGGTSIFGLVIWNYASKKPAFIGCTNNGKMMTDYPIYIYNKNTGRFVSSITDEPYYHGVLASSGGETNVKYRTLSKGKGTYNIHVAGIGMIYPYINQYDNSDIYTYYINTYFKIGTRKYRLIVSSNWSYSKDYVVQRIK